jgi:hypothetical protein
LLKEKAKMHRLITRALSLASLWCLALGGGAALAGGVTTKSGNAPASFDIVQTEIRSTDKWLEFRMQVSGAAGTTKPTATGKLAGSDVFAYVWPTKIDSSEVGFEPGQGILAFTVTAHPDFDDTPLFDENGDSDLENDGNVWHSHWVVLVEDKTCGPAALKVKDIPSGTKPKLPPTWPGLPILIDSPGYDPRFAGPEVLVRVPFRDLGAVAGTAYDGVTAGLRVNANVHAPLLCVADVFDIASGDLSMPGKVSKP